jgi:hypothetical protein
MAPRPRSKAQPAPLQPALQPALLQPAPVEGEAFNFDDVSDTSEEEPPAPAKGRAAANILDDETTRVAPIIKSSVKSNRALDIDLLFNRGKGKHSVCKICK